MAYPAMDVAKAFIQLANKENVYENVEITHLKVQKLLYYTQGWSMAFFNKPFIDESIQAWRYGPVVVSVYSALKRYGNNQILLDETADYLAKITDQDDRTLLLEVWRVYGKLSGLELSRMTHATTTWQGRYDCTFGFHDSGQIDNAELKDYFLGLQKKAKAAVG